MLNKRGFEKIDVLFLLVAILFASVLVWNYFSGFLERNELPKTDISPDEEVFGSPDEKYLDDSGNEILGFFREGTNVMMFDRTWKKIELLKEGDYVLSYDLDTKEDRFSKVLRIREFKLSGYSVLNNNLEVNSNTLFLSDGKWKLLGDLKKGDILFDYSDSKIKVDSINAVKKDAIFYNLQLDKPYIYYVRGVYANREENLGIAIPDTSHISESYLVRSGA